MLRRMILGCVAALACSGVASAGGYFYGHHNSYFHYAAPQAPYYGGYAAPVVYYRVPIYIIPARRPRCGCVAPPAASVMQSTPAVDSTPAPAKDPISTPAAATE